MFLLRKRFWITVAKLAALAFPAILAGAQIPELRYDLGPASPVEITSVADLKQYSGAHSVFVSVRGKGDFDKAFINQTHGQSYAYFLLEPYGNMLVVRSYEKPAKDDESWRKIDRWVGRLQPIRRMAFRRSVLGTFSTTCKTDVPADAFYLARDDVPALSGWQIAALIYSVLLFAGLLYFLFIRPRRKKKITSRSPSTPTSSASTDPR